MTNSDLPFLVEIPTLRKSCELGKIKEPACVYCKHYSFQIIGAPSGWCDLFPCQQVNTSEEMVCDLYERRKPEESKYYAQDEG